MDDKIFFLDSGAFSAYTQGATIPIEDYISFIKRNEHRIDIYANLDVIGSPEGTWQNQLIMEESGLLPLPVFHFDEPTSYLRRYIKQYDFIALGGMVPISTPNLIFWLDTIFSEFICDKNGMPKVKVHGFGMTTQSLLLRYPWYSVDSTYPIINGAMGRVFVPRLTKGEWDYTRPFFAADVSNRSPNMGKYNQHYNTLSPRKKEMVQNYVEYMGYEMGESTWCWEQPRTLAPNEKWFGEEQAGERLMEIIVLRGVTNSHVVRKIINIETMNRMSQQLPQWPWAFKPRKNHILFR